MFDVPGWQKEPGSQAGEEAPQIEAEDGDRLRWAGMGLIEALRQMEETECGGSKESD